MGDSTVFVVRVWQGVKPFRATARAVDQDAVISFSEPIELLQFLVPRSGSETATAGDDASQAVTSDESACRSGQPNDV